MDRCLLAKAKREERELAEDMKQWIALPAVEKAAEDVADIFERAGRKLRERFGPAASTAMSRAIVEAIVLFAAAAGPAKLLPSTSSVSADGPGKLLPSTLSVSADRRGSPRPSGLTRPAGGRRR